MVLILYKEGLKIGVQDIHIKFTIYEGAYSFYDFKVKVKVAVLQQRQDWNLLQIKNLKLVIPKHCMCIASDNFFAELVYLATILERLQVTSLTKFRKWKNIAR